MKHYLSTALVLSFLLQPNTEYLNAGKKKNRQANKHNTRSITHKKSRTNKRLLPLLNKNHLLKLRKIKELRLPACFRHIYQNINQPKQYITPWIERSRTHLYPLMTKKSVKTSALLFGLVFLASYGLDSDVMTTMKTLLIYSGLHSAFSVITEPFTQFVKKHIWKTARSQESVDKESNLSVVLKKEVTDQSNAYYNRQTTLTGGGHTLWGKTGITGWLNETKPVILQSTQQLINDTENLAPPAQALAALVYETIVYQPEIIGDSEVIFVAGATISQRSDRALMTKLEKEVIERFKVLSKCDEDTAIASTFIQILLSSTRPENGN